MIEVEAPFRLVEIPSQPHLNMLEWDEEITAPGTDRVQKLPFRTPVHGRGPVPGEKVARMLEMCQGAVPALRENARLQERVADLEAEVERLQSQLAQERSQQPQQRLPRKGA